MVMRCAPDVLTGSASTRPLWKLKARLQLDKLLGMTDVHARAPHTTRRPGTRAGTRAPDWLIEDVAVHAEAAADRLDAQRLARDPAVELLHRGALRELCGRDGSAPRRIDFHRSASELFAPTDAQVGSHQILAGAAIGARAAGGGGARTGRRALVAPQLARSTPGRQRDSALRQRDLPTQRDPRLNAIAQACSSSPDLRQQQASTQAATRTNRSVFEPATVV